MEMGAPGSPCRQRVGPRHRLGQIVAPARPRTHQLTGLVQEPVLGEVGQGLPGRRGARVGHLHGGRGLGLDHRKSCVGQPAQRRPGLLEAGRGVAGVQAHAELRGQTEQQAGRVPAGLDHTPRFRLQTHTHRGPLVGELGQHPGELGQVAPGPVQAARVPGFAPGQGQGGHAPARRVLRHEAGQDPGAVDRVVQAGPLGPVRVVDAVLDHRVLEPPVREGVEGDRLQTGRVQPAAQPVDQRGIGRQLPGQRRRGSHRPSPRRSAPRRSRTPPPNTRIWRSTPSRSSAGCTFVQ